MNFKNWTEVQLDEIQNMLCDPLHCISECAFVITVMISTCILIRLHDKLTSCLGYVLYYISALLYTVFIVKWGIKLL